jgi:hypothetical protein
VSTFLAISSALCVVSPILIAFTIGVTSQSDPLRALPAL